MVFQLCLQKHILGAFISVIMSSALGKDSVLVLLKHIKAAIMAWPGEKCNQKY